MNDLEITTLVKRLSRPHPSGGTVIERAALMAAGGDYPAIIAWITTHEGTPETNAPPARSRGLHGSRMHGGGDPVAPETTRFVLPAGALH